jgi:hypothetical protein
MTLDVKFEEQSQSFDTTFNEQNQSFNVDFGEVQTVGGGENGATFIPNVSQSGIISWTNNKGLENPTPVNIKGEKGDKGDKGDRGEQGIQGIQGAKGTDGVNGKDGQNGKDGTNGTNGKDGTNGQDGFSPIVQVADIQGGHKVTITDKDGAKTFDVMDGKDGQGGSGGGANADWSVNDPNADGYVKNRTHWVEPSLRIEISEFDGNLDGRDFFDASAIGLGIFVKVSDQVLTQEQCKTANAEFGNITFYSYDIIYDDNIGFVWGTGREEAPFMASCFTAIDLTDVYGFSIPSAGLYVCCTEGNTITHGFMITDAIYHPLPINYMPPEIIKSTYFIPLHYVVLYVDGDERVYSNISGEITDEERRLIDTADKLGFQIEFDREPGVLYYIIITPSKKPKPDYNSIIYGSAFIYDDEKKEVIQVYAKIDTAINGEWRFGAKTVQTKSQIQTMIDSSISSLNKETWTFTLEDGTVVEKEIVLS